MDTINVHPKSNDMPAGGLNKENTYKEGEIKGLGSDIKYFQIPATSFQLSAS